MSTLTSSSYQSTRHPHHHQQQQQSQSRFVTRESRFIPRNGHHHLLSESSSSSSGPGTRQHYSQCNLHSTENDQLNRHVTCDTSTTAAAAAANQCLKCSNGIIARTHLTRYPMPDVSCDLNTHTNNNSHVNSHLHSTSVLPHSSSTVNHSHCHHHSNSSQSGHNHISSSPTGPLSYPSFYTFKKKTPKRYFNLGLFCCCAAGFVFTLGLILMVWGSSPHEPNAIWISGIVFLFTGGFLFFLGISSIGLYLSREDGRKKKDEIERTRARQYAASLSSVRSLTRSSDIYLID